MAVSGNRFGSKWVAVIPSKGTSAPTVEPRMLHSGRLVRPPPQRSTSGSKSSLRASGLSDRLEPMHSS